ncbi:DUF222 domain-containing protein [Nocardioides convexus]|uniref:DUF222 domain-containing protein n=1 Tax=Nocardioides convexus TaxID=2712224 RepID=UPI003100BA40
MTIDHASLSQGVIDQGRSQEGRTGADARLSAQSVRRLACDAEILPAVLGSESQVLDVGRAQRLVTPAIWSALLVRDRHCAFPGAPGCLSPATRTTSSTGPTAARPASTTWCCSAGTITP